MIGAYLYEDNNYGAGQTTPKRTALSPGSYNLQTGFTDTNPYKNTSSLDVYPFTNVTLYSDATKTGGSGDSLTRDAYGKHIKIPVMSDIPRNALAKTTWGDVAAYAVVNYLPGRYNDCCSTSNKDPKRNTECGEYYLGSEKCKGRDDVTYCTGVNNIGHKVGPSRFGEVACRNWYEHSLSKQATHSMLEYCATPSADKAFCTKHKSAVADNVYKCCESRSSGIACDEYLKDPKACKSAAASYCNDVKLNLYDPATQKEIVESPQCKQWCVENPQECGVVANNYCSGIGGLPKEQQLWRMGTTICRSWCLANPGKCDPAAKTYCDTDNPDQQFCACLKSPASKIIDPRCIGNSCSGYVPSAPQCGYDSAGKISCETAKKLADAKISVDATRKPTCFDGAPSGIDCCLLGATGKRCVAYPLKSDTCTSINAGYCNETGAHREEPACKQWCLENPERCKSASGSHKTWSNTGTSSWLIYGVFFMFVLVVAIAIYYRSNQRLTSHIN